MCVKEFLFSSKDENDIRIFLKNQNFPFVFYLAKIIQYRPPRHIARMEAKMGYVRRSDNAYKGSTMSVRKIHGVILQGL